MVFTAKFKENEWRIFDGSIFYARADTEEEARQRAFRLNIVERVVVRIEEEINNIIESDIEPLGQKAGTLVIRELLDYSGDGRNFTFNMESWLY